MFYYRKPVDGSAIAEMKCYQWDKAMATVIFDEMHIVKSDDFYYLYIHAQSFSDSCNSKDDKWAFPEDTKVVVAVARKDYKEYDRKLKQEKTVVQTRLEKALCACFEKYIVIDGFYYSGRLSLQDLTLLERLLPDKDGNHQPIPQEVEGIILDSLYKLAPYPTNQARHFTKDELIIPAGNKNGNTTSFAPKGQTYKDKATDKFNWIKEHLKAKYPALRIETMYDLSEHGLSEQPVPDEIKCKANDVYRTCLEFLNHL